MHYATTAIHPLERREISPRPQRDASPLVTVSGWGLCTPLGVDAQQTWDALLHGRFIEEHSAVPLSVRAPRAIALARRASAEACAGLRHIDGEESALVVGTSKGPVESWLTPHQRIDSFAYEPAGRLDSSGLGEIAAALEPRFTGPRLTVSAACASGLHALIRAAMLLKSGEAKRALVVAVESSLHPLFINSFARLGVFPKPLFGCRPYDRFRDGFLMSEAAAAIMLEAVDHTDSAAGETFDRDGILLIDRFTLGGDATHITAGDPQARTLRHVLRHVLDRRPVDLIHGHGTGTAANDEIELATIEDVLSANLLRPSLYSHKGTLGHTLGASGLVAVVLNCMSHRNGIIPPNVQTRHPLPTTCVELSCGKVHRRVKRSIAIAAGFGGPIAAISLQNR